MPLPDAWLDPVTGKVDPSKLPPAQTAVTTAPAAPEPVPATGKEQFGPPAPRKEYPETLGPLLWMRKWKLTIGDKPGSNALDLSLLAFSFDINIAAFLGPHIGIITVYNAPTDIITRMDQELTYIVLEAGYVSGQYGIVFQGPIAYYKRGRMNATDTYVEIYATMHDQPITQGMVNAWLPAGHTKLDVLKAAVMPLQTWGIELGSITDLGDEKSPRGRTLAGMSVDIIRDIADTANANAFFDIQTNEIHMHKNGETLKMAIENVPVLNSRSGLIDVPTVTLGGGVEARCLLNTNIRVNGLVKIAEVPTFTGVHEGVMVGTAFKLETMKLVMSGNGFYTANSVRHYGESRGNPWYTEIKSSPADPTQIPIGIRKEF